MPIPNNGYIKLNNTTGSSTTASGCGASNLYGSNNAMFSSGSNTIQVSGGGGISPGDVLWVDANASSGGSTNYREFFEVVSESGGYVTTVEQTTNSAMGVSWAVGGTRRTLGDVENLLSNPLQNGATSFELETDQLVYWQTNQVATGSTFAFKSDDELVKRKITIYGNDFFKPGSINYCENILFKPYNPTGITLGGVNGAFGGYGGDCIISCYRCDIGELNGNTFDAVWGGSFGGDGILRCNQTLVYQSPFGTLCGEVDASNSMFYQATGYLFSTAGQLWTADARFHSCVLAVPSYCSYITNPSYLCEKTRIEDCVLRGGVNGTDYWGAALTQGGDDTFQSFTNNVLVDFPANSISYGNNMSRTKYYNMALAPTATEFPTLLPGDPFVAGVTLDFNLNNNTAGDQLRDQSGDTLINTLIYPYRYLLDQLPSGGGNVILIEDN